MSQEDQQLDENGMPTLDETRNSDDNGESADEFADLFADDGDEDAPVSREEYNRLLKGTKKLATELGRIKTTKVEKKEEAPIAGDVNPVLKSLYFKQNPEAQEVWEEVVREAKSLGKDPFALYEGSSYFKGEAKARFSEKSEQVENKNKLQAPSSNASFGSNMEAIYRMDDESQAAAIRSMSSKDYTKWKDHLRSKSSGSSLLQL
jgi:hypothetical protein